jgi:hypothetical protein
MKKTAKTTTTTTTTTAVLARRGSLPGGPGTIVNSGLRVESACGAAEQELRDVGVWFNRIHGVDVPVDGRSSAGGVDGTGFKHEPPPLMPQGRTGRGVLRADLERQLENCREHVDWLERGHAPSTGTVLRTWRDDPGPRRLFVEQNDMKVAAPQRVELGRSPRPYVRTSCVSTGRQRRCCLPTQTESTLCNGKD